MTKQTKMLMFVGLPLMVLFLAGIAITAFLSVNLLVQGVQTRSPGSIALGLLLAAMWLMMFVKTMRSRRTALNTSPATKS